jgi:four helix bundle protein
MALEFEELRVLQAAEAVADGVWEHVARWDPFARDVVGKQLARAMDSVGANVAEAYGRFHYGEKLQFLYYARGSLFEAKYWLNRAQARGLMSASDVKGYASRLTILARQINAFSGRLKAQRREHQSDRKATREAAADYDVMSSRGIVATIFTEEDLAWLSARPDGEQFVTHTE